MISTGFQAVRDAGGESQDRRELMRVIHAYNGATERLRRTHETLTEEVRRLRQQLASANEALHRSRRLAALGEMAAGIAHEVRNPLGSIHLYARMLEQDLRDRPQERDIAARIGQAVRGLNAVVGDVLAFSQELRLDRQLAPLRPTIDSAVDLLRPSLESAGITVHFEGEGRGPRVCHDCAMLHRAFVNLLRNATDAMPGGGRVTCQVRRDDASVQVIIRDTGPGISAEAMDRIFNPFFTTRPTGTGLGLAIVHRIMDAHGGSIAVHNDGGAVFTLTLPMDGMHEAEQ